MKKLLILAAAIMMVGCKHIEYVMVPEVHEYHHNHTDSIHQTDSIIREKQTTIMQLDSTAMAQYGIQLKAAERAWLVKTAELERQLQRIAEMHNDTVEVRDSIPYPVEVVRKVPTELTWWQKTRLHLGELMLGVVGVLITIGIIRIKKKIFK